MHNSLKRVSEIVAAKGCKATTIRGKIKFAKKFGLSLPYSYKEKKKWISFAIEDSELGALATKNAIKNSKKKNWENARPSINKENHFTVNHINNGRYSSRCTYIRWSYQAVYHSELKIARSSKAVAEFYQGGKLIKRLFAPSGLKWGWDNNGPYLISKDGTEYHPTVEDLKANNFAYRIRSELSNTRKLRKEASKKSKIQQRLIKNCYVTLQDSRKAGNCLAGTITYLTSRGYDRRYITSPYAKVKATKLNLEDVRVKRAVQIAIERETMVSI